MMGVGAHVVKLEPYTKLGQRGKVPVFGHISLLVVPFVDALGGANFARTLAFSAIVLAHEAGHAWLARRRGFEVTELRIHALGGECSYRGLGAAIDHAVVAWGGVLGQLALVPVGLALGFFHGKSSGFARDLVDGLIAFNALIALINLLPFKPLDGARAWSYFGLARRAELETVRALIQPSTPVQRAQRGRTHLRLVKGGRARR